MPLPILHCLINLCAFFPFRKKLGQYWLVFVIFSSLLLDFDFILNLFAKLLNYNPLFMHGGLMHTYGFVLFLFAISLFVYSKNKEYGIYGFILTIGSAIHLFLDFLLGGGSYSLMLFYPFSEHLFRLHLFENYGFAGQGFLEAFILIILSIYLLLKINSTSKKTN